MTDSNRSASPKHSDDRSYSPKRKGQRPKKNGNRSRQNQLYPRLKPFPDEEEQSKHLEGVLRDLGLYESKEGLEKRQKAFDDIEDLLNCWSASLSKPIPLDSINHVPQPVEKQARIALISFGSYRLGVQKPEADMDLLALCPSHCSRDDFFASLVEILKDNSRIEEVHPIAVAYTPVIKFKFDGIAIDLLFARLSNDEKLHRHKKGESYVIEDSDLKDLDEAGVRSLNGARVAQILSSCAPDAEAFRTTLIAVKEWACVHGLYSNVLGFLGGINYAILVACVCKSNRGAKPATLLKAFFQTYSQWKWPTPVTLTHVTYTPPEGVNPLPVWNAKKNPRDRMHLMPILTPTYPTMNSAYNVGLPQLRRLKSEFQNAVRILNEIEKGEKSWMALFQGNEFFKRHAYFLQINISASNAKSFLEWYRFVESRLRLLIAGLESPHHGVQAEPFCKFYDRAYNSDGVCIGPGKSAPNCKNEACLFVALRFGYGIDNADLSYGVAEFLHKVNSWNGRDAGMDVEIEVVQSHQLPNFLIEKSLCEKLDIEHDKNREQKIEKWQKHDDSSPSAVTWAMKVTGNVQKRPRT